MTPPPNGKHIYIYHVNVRHLPPPLVIWAGLLFLKKLKENLHIQVNILMLHIVWFQDKYELTVSMVVNGTKMVYVPIMPGHRKRLPQK